MIQHRKYLARGTPPRRSGKRIKAKGKARFKVSGQPDRAYRAWIRKQVCAIPATSTWLPDWSLRAVIHACHVRSRGAGGRDYGNLVPMCATHHQEQHSIGQRSFEKRHGVNLKALAAYYQGLYEGQSNPPWLAERTPEGER